MSIESKDDMHCVIDRQNANEMRRNYDFSPHLNWNYSSGDERMSFMIGVCVCVASSTTAAQSISFTFTLTQFISHCVLRIVSSLFPLCSIVFLVLLIFLSLLLLPLLFR